MKLFTKWLICLGALFLTSVCFPARVSVYGGILTLAAAATILWLANLAVKPVLQVLALPITLVTFGIFSIVVNAGMVALTDFIIPIIKIRGFGICLFTAVVISIGNGLFGVKPRKS